MSRVFYVEPEEEITELVERIRDSGGEQELGFVLPNRARVLQSVLNLRLLSMVAPSANVTVVLKAAPVKVDGVIIQATPDSTAATAPDKVLTVVTTSDQSQPFDAKPTGKRDVPAAASTASVQFQNAFNT